VSFSVALYALILFYVLTRDNLLGKQPLAKFLSIKLIVFFTFCERNRLSYVSATLLTALTDQGFLFGILQSHNVIKGTAYWTATNVADGLQALCTCVEVGKLLMPRLSN
jgi:hypothetical protein